MHQEIPHESGDVTDEEIEEYIDSDAEAPMYARKFEHSSWWNESDSESETEIELEPETPLNSSSPKLKKNLK